MMRKGNHYYTYRAVLSSTLVYILLISLLAFNSLSSPVQEEEEGIYMELEDIQLIKPELPLTEERLEEMSTEEKRNFAVNKALETEDKTDPYDYSDVEDSDEEYEASLVKKAISESEYKKIFEREDLDFEENDISQEDIVETKPQKEKSETISNYQGSTYISYFLENRSKKKIPVPTYKCETSGTIIVNIEVNRKGKVRYYQISSKSTDDKCLKDAAIQSVRNAKFNKSKDAPLKQRGTITYIFEAQK